MLWRPEAEAAFNFANKLNRALTGDPKWLRHYPHVVAYSYQIRQRAYEVLSHIDQLLLELDIMKAYREAPPDEPDSYSRPSVAPQARKRSGKARKYHDDASSTAPKGTNSTAIQ